MLKIPLLTWCLLFVITRLNSILEGITGMFWGQKLTLAQYHLVALFNLEDWKKWEMGFMAELS